MSAGAKSSVTVLLENWVTVEVVDFGRDIGGRFVKVRARIPNDLDEVKKLRKGDSLKLTIARNWKDA